IPCHNSSVMNGRNGWNNRRAWLNTKSITATVLALRASSAPCSTALVASTYQSQYSLQKKRYNVAVASLNLYSANAVFISRMAASSLSKIHLSSDVSSCGLISPWISAGEAPADAPEVGALPTIWRKRQAFQSLLQKLRPSS